MPIRITHRPDFEGRRLLLRRLRLQALREVVGNVEREILSRYAAGTGAATLGVRSSRLRSAPKREFSEQGGTISGRVFIPESGGKTDPVYARIHELGGEIKPKKGRYLAIPLKALRRGAAGGSSLSPKDFPFGGFFFRSKKGNLIYAVREKGTQGRVIPLFVMKESVRIPRRPVWAVTMANQRPQILARFDALAN